MFGQVKIRLVWLSLVLALVVTMVPLLVACGSDGEETPTPGATVPGATPTLAPDAKIVIGELTALTGIYASHLAGMHSGGADYWKYVNEVKGGINGIPVEFIYADTKYETALIMTEYRRLVDAGAVIIYPAISLATDMLKEHFAQDEIPAVTNTGGLSAWWPPGWVYGVFSHNFADLSAAAAEWIVENWTEDRPVRVAYLFPDASYGRLSTMSIPYVDAMEMAEVVAEEYHPQLPFDLTPQLMRIRDADADWIITGGMSPHLPALVRGLDSLGMRGEIPVITTSMPNTGDVFVDYPELAPLLEGLYGVAYIAIFSKAWTEWVPGYEFALELWQKYHDPDAEIWEGMYAAYFAGSMVIEEAIKRALDAVGYESLTGRAIKEYGLDTIENFEVMGLCPPITYTPDDHGGVRQCRVFQWVNGEFVLLEDWRDTPIIKPEE